MENKINAVQLFAAAVLGSTIIASGLIVAAMIIKSEVSESALRIEQAVLNIPETQIEAFNHDVLIDALEGVSINVVENPIVPKSNSKSWNYTDFKIALEGELLSTINRGWVKKVDQLHVLELKSNGEVIYFNFEYERHGETYNVSANLVADGFGGFLGEFPLPTKNALRDRIIEIHII